MVQLQNIATVVTTVDGIIKLHFTALIGTRTDKHFMYKIKMKKKLRIRRDPINVLNLKNEISPPNGTPVDLSNNRSSPASLSKHSVVSAGDCAFCQWGLPWHTTRTVTQTTLTKMYWSTQDFSETLCQARVLSWFAFHLRFYINVHGGFWLFHELNAYTLPGYSICAYRLEKNRNQNKNQHAYIVKVWTFYSLFHCNHFNYTYYKSYYHFNWKWFREFNFTMN